MRNDSKLLISKTKVYARLCCGELFIAENDAESFCIVKTRRRAPHPVLRIESYLVPEWRARSFFLRPSAFQGPFDPFAKILRGVWGFSAYVCVLTFLHIAVKTSSTKMRITFVLPQCTFVWCILCFLTRNFFIFPRTPLGSLFSTWLGLPSSVQLLCTLNVSKILVGAFQITQCTCQVRSLNNSELLRGPLHG